MFFRMKNRSQLSQSASSVHKANLALLRQGHANDPKEPGFLSKIFGKKG
jgi:hypothetical protein